MKSVGIGYQEILLDDELEVFFVLSSISRNNLTRRFYDRQLSCLHFSQKVWFMLSFLCLV